MRALFVAAALAVLVTPRAAVAQSADSFSMPSREDSVIALKSGRVLRGAILERDLEHVTVRTLDGQVVRVATAEIDENAALTPSGSSRSALPVLGIIATVAVCAGAGLLIASLPTHDPDARRGLQISGAVTLASGGGLGIVVIGVSLVKGASVFGATK